jgi:leucyl-tRNA synthetase
MPSGKKELLVTAAIPYVNAPQHIGHLRTFGTADVFGRYKRMQGYNVLFPMGFHGTGTPILAFAKRVKEKDMDLLEEFKMFDIPEDEIAKFIDPEYIVEYFANETAKGMKRIGFGIDWRRSFVTLDPIFAKFVEWQFIQLEKNGLLVKDRHPLGWCTNDNNAVGMHDTKHDVEPEIEKETAIKFKVEGEEAFVACATYRPETIYGVTNVFVCETAKYSLCDVFGESIYIEEKAAQKLLHQFEIKINKTIEGKELIGKKVVNPITSESIPILPGFFVKEGVGTGIVMSVPAHAPFDYAAIERLRQSGYDVSGIKPKKIIDVDIGRSISDVAVGEAKPEHKEIPALAYLEILHTNVNAINDMLEFATKIQYREESHWGKMIVSGFEGMGEPEAREKIKNMLLSKDNAFEIYILSNAPVFCRCGHEVIVKVIDDQWFLNYGDAKWKVLAKEALNNAKIYPEKLRQAFSGIIDWLNLRAVARSQGLGTKFPLNKNLIIESLSDSTMYMPFYTLLPYIRGIEPEKLKPEFFDFVLLGKGGAEETSKQTGIDYDIVQKCRESFTYWYAETSRHSYSDLIANHLTMYLFNHSIILDRKYWPKQIVVNGGVLSEGEKMSKSLGNTVPLMKAIKMYGADPLRISVIAGADLNSDFEFSVEAINGIKERLEFLNSILDKLHDYEPSELKSADYLMYSRLNKKIKNATEAMEGMELRDAMTNVLYNSVIELKDYFSMGGNNEITLREFLQDIVLMLQPVAPHVSEEMWHNLGNNTFASLEKWPSANEGMINDKLEKQYENLGKNIEDIKSLISLMGRKGSKPKGIKLIVASEWKREVLNNLAETKTPSKAIDKIGSNPEINKEEAAKLVEKFAKNMGSLKKIDASEDEEFAFLKEHSEYISKAVNIEVTVEKESESKSPRAERALPMKPSIEML